MRLDPQAQCLRFGSAAFPKADGGVGDRRYSNQLSSLARQLAAVVDIISPTDPVAKGDDRARFYNIVASKVESEHEAALERQVFQVFLLFVFVLFQQSPCHLTVPQGKT